MHLYAKWVTVSNGVICTHAFISETKDESAGNVMENKAMWKRPEAGIFFRLLTGLKLVGSFWVYVTYVWKLQCLIAMKNAIFDK